MQASAFAADQFLADIQSRSSGHGAARSPGITTAASYLRDVRQCLGGVCPSQILKGVSSEQWQRYEKAAERRLVYHCDGMEPIASGFLRGVDAQLVAKAMAGIQLKDPVGGVSNGISGDIGGAGPPGPGTPSDLGTPYQLSAHQLPPHTIATFPAVITTTRQDRDGDILETPGAWLDPKSCLLYNHIPVENIGRLLAELKRTDSMLPGLFSIMDTPFANDVSIMAEHGSLRISHGFLPSEVEPLDQEEYPGGGYRVLKFSIVEVSLVSIPSNPDAEITAFSRNKLTHPLLKAVAEGKFRGRVKMVPVRIDVAGLEKAKAMAESRIGVVVESVGKRLNGSDTIRWNKSLPEAFDVAAESVPPSKMIYDWAMKYLGVPVKKIHESSVFVPSAKIGSFLCAWEDVTADYVVYDVRNIHGDSEWPPTYSMIQLDSKQSRDFLIEGTAFLKGPIKLIAKMEPTWGGLGVKLLAKLDDRHTVTELPDKAWQLVKEKFNFLKGEAFSLSGEFIPATSETWDDVFLSSENQSALTRAVDLLNQKQESFANRGIVMLGPPGTGKTLSGRIIRNTTKATFIWLSARDFYYSGAFGGISYGFDLAKELAPAVLFMEDVDNWMGDKTIDLLKTEMDGIGRTKGILTILTTNYPERFPDALIDRPGRFHDVLKIDLPDKAARSKMLAKWAGELPGDVTDSLIKETSGWSGAHMYELAQFAKILQEQDGVGLAESLTAAVAKIKQQRELITQAQLGGSNYRPRKHVLGQINRKSASGSVVHTCTCQQHKDAQMSLSSSTPAIELKSVVPYHDTPVADEAWDADAAIKSLREWSGVNGEKPTAAEFDKYEEGFALIEGDKDNLTSYKLPHHTIKGGKLVVVPKGVSAAIGALNGARGGGMDISEGDRKGAYDHLVKHYKKCFPDQEPPELKSLEAIEKEANPSNPSNPSNSPTLADSSAASSVSTTKGFYLATEDSFEDIEDDLQQLAKPYLMENHLAGAADCVFIAQVTINKTAIICCVEDMLYGSDSGYCGPGCWSDDDDRCYYQCGWEMGTDQEPYFTGEPVKVNPTIQLTEAAKRVFAMTKDSLQPIAKGVVTDEHVKSLNEANDYLEQAHEHAEATSATKMLSGRAQKHVKAVIEAHEKGMLTAGHKGRLEKAMGYCSQGMEHEEATKAVKKCFKSAHGLIDGILKDVGEDVAGGSEPGEAAAQGVVSQGMGTTVAQTSQTAAGADGKSAVVTTKTAALFSRKNVRKAMSAYHGFRSIAHHDDSHPTVSALANKAADTISGLFASGGDNASDYGANGDAFNAGDLDAYTDAEEDGAEAGGGKSVDDLELKAVNQRHSAVLGEAIAHGKSIVAHEEATGFHKAAAHHAVQHLNSIVGKDAADGDDGEDSSALPDDDGDMSYYGGNPRGQRSIDTIDTLAEAQRAADRFMKAAAVHHMKTGSVNAFLRLKNRIEHTTGRMTGQAAAN